MACLPRSPWILACWPLLPAAACTPAMADGPPMGDVGLTPVSSFLGTNLAEHSSLLKDAGYDDVSDFCNIDDEELSALADSLISQRVPIGHVRKIERLIKAIRQESSREHVRVPPAARRQLYAAEGNSTPATAAPQGPFVLHADTASHSNTLAQAGSHTPCPVASSTDVWYRCR